MSFCVWNRCSSPEIKSQFYSRKTTKENKWNFSPRKYHQFFWNRYENIHMRKNSALTNRNGPGIYIFKYCGIGVHRCLMKMKKKIILILLYEVFHSSESFYVSVVSFWLRFLLILDRFLPDIFFLLPNVIRIYWTKNNVRKVQNKKKHETEQASLTWKEEIFGSTKLYFTNSTNKWAQYLPFIYQTKIWFCKTHILYNLKTPQKHGKHKINHTENIMGSFSLLC